MQLPVFVFGTTPVLSDPEQIKSQVNKPDELFTRGRDKQIDKWKHSTTQN